MSSVILACALFGIGLYGTLVRRDLIAVLACVEVMMGAALLLLLALGSNLGGGAAIEAIGVLVLVLAAAEAAVGLALVVVAARVLGTTRLDEIDEVRG
ncbi:MAG: NADH-quinone oxidoreductase subunit K [Coriobacteriia bacterium]|nr:NADH-quinone oxidoreductase subunit K [Coriobacteriia bacterium]